MRGLARTSAESDRMLRGLHETPPAPTGLRERSQEVPMQTSVIGFACKNTCFLTILEWPCKYAPLAVQVRALSKGSTRPSRLCSGGTAARRCRETSRHKMRLPAEHYRRQASREHQNKHPESIKIMNFETFEHSDNELWEMNYEVLETLENEL